MPDLKDLPEAGQLPDLSQRSLRAVQDAVESVRDRSNIVSAVPPAVVPATANFRVVSNGLADLQKRLDEVKGKAERLHKQLVGGEIPLQNHKMTQQPNGTVFDHLAYQAIHLARLVGEIDALISRSGEALK